MSFEKIGELDEGIFEVSNYKNRTNLAMELKPHLPFYVLYEEKIIFRAESVSKKYFRDKPGTEILAADGSISYNYSKDTEKMAVSTGQMICKTKEDAERVSKFFMARKIKERMPNLRIKFNRYQKFIDDNPEYFI